jgi:hypothetical protein
MHVILLQEAAAAPRDGEGPAKRCASGYLYGNYPHSSPALILLALAFFHPSCSPTLFGLLSSFFSHSGQACQAHMLATLKIQSLRVFTVLLPPMPLLTMPRMS